MNRDYEFGKHIYKLRTERGLTQTDVANFLKISDRAVSKWENGSSKPTINNLNKLSELFDISLDELLNYGNKVCNSKVFKIVLTGGPCGGKHDALESITKVFKEKGYKVIAVPSFDRYLKNCGLDPNSFTNHEDYEQKLLELQLNIEDFIDNMINDLPDEKILVIYNRGLLDIKSFCTNREFTNICRNLGFYEEELRNRYDAVFHLKSAYKLGNRVEEEKLDKHIDYEQAMALDEKLVDCWSPHGNFRIINAYHNFDDKLKKVVNEVSMFLHEDNSKYIEKKFLIKVPELDKLLKVKSVNKAHLVQNYISTSHDNDVKVVLRMENGKSFFYKITKNPHGRFIEKIAADDYIISLENNKVLRKIVKDRYTFVFENKRYKLDIFENFFDFAILEVDLLNDSDKVNFPSFVEVLQDVSGDYNFKNFNINLKGE